MPGCARCHGNNGSGGKQGPDLAHFGAEATHTQQWFIDLIKDPKSQKPNAKMPGFDGKIQATDITAIAAYLITPLPHHSITLSLPHSITLSLHHLITSSPALQENLADSTSCVV